MCVPEGVKGSGAAQGIFISLTCHHVLIVVAGQGTARGVNQRNPLCSGLTFGSAKEEQITTCRVGPFNQHGNRRLAYRGGEWYSHILGNLSIHKKRQQKRKEEESFHHSYGY